MASSPLASHQVRALFDLLIHHQLYYGEIIKFNDPDGIDGYGPPFDSKEADPSSAPILQTLLQRFVLSLPGAISLPEAFWERVRELVKRFAAANMSDSYDHTGLGLRRTLATGWSAILEYPARGCFARLQFRQFGKRDADDYDPKDAEDIKEAWDHFLHELVHGDLIDEMFERIAETDDLSLHPPMVQAAHEYILVNVASVLHNVFVQSPDGGYLQKLVSNVLSLMPWTILRQSLRIGNAASMINAVTKLFLTKLSITSFTNWIGWSNSLDDGMNLMQQIISTIVGWDIAEYQKHLAAIEKLEDAPSTEHLTEIRLYLEASRDFQSRLRKRSMDESKSIITVIADEASLSPLTDSAHDLAMEYLAFCSSIRNREQLAKIVCKSQPDILTAALKEAVAAYDPLIRRLHSCVDLSATCWDLECYLNDFMALFKRIPSDPTKTESETKEVTVAQIAAVLRKHQRSVHRFLHTVAKSSEDITDEYRVYVKNVAIQFNSLTPPDGSRDEYAGDMAPALHNLVNDLGEEDRKKAIEALDNYAAYLMALDSVSDDRLRGVLLESNDGEGENVPGLGTYLARWRTLLNSTPITPLSPRGRVRYGTVRAHGAANGDVDHVSDLQKDAEDDRWRWPDPPKDRDVVIKLLGSRFAEVLGEVGKENWQSAPLSSPDKAGH